MSFIDNKERSLLYRILFILIITEIIDTLLDNFLGNNIEHLFIQLLLFISLYVIMVWLVKRHDESIKNVLLPEELVDVLKTIELAERKGILLNQSAIRKKVGVTKPTLKKRLDSLMCNGYIFSEKRGKNIYFKLAEKGTNAIS